MSWPLMVVTDRSQAATTGRDLEDVVARAVDGGARLVLLRDKDLPRGPRAALARRLLAVLAPTDGWLLVGGDRELAGEVGAAGVHLAASDPLPEPGGVGGAAGGRLLVGRSCHGVDELRAAAASSLDYATLSPVWPTDSKPGYGPPLGASGLAAACAAVPGLPVYALGGIGPGRVAGCLAAGAAGVAVMGAIMRADDPAETVRLLLEEIP